MVFVNRTTRYRTPIVKWLGPNSGPDGYTLDVSSSIPDSWVYAYDSERKPVMAFKPGGSGEDGTLLLSIDGAPSLIATLLHAEDDEPRKYYFATDGNHVENVLKRPAFILKCEGYSDCPVQEQAQFFVMIVKP